MDSEDMPYAVCVYKHRIMGDYKTDKCKDTGEDLTRRPSRSNFHALHSHILYFNDEPAGTGTVFDANEFVDVFPSTFPVPAPVQNVPTERTAAYYITQYGRGVDDTTTPQVQRSHNNFLPVHVHVHMDDAVGEGGNQQY